MAPSQQTHPPNQSLAELKKEVSSSSPTPPFVGEVLLDKKTAISPEKVVDTSEITSKILQLEELVRDISLDSILARKEELEDALFILEKEHINGLASDASYLDIKTKIIKELRKMDEKLAVIKSYFESNKTFRTEFRKVEDSLSKIVVIARAGVSPESAGSPRQEIENSLSDLTKKYLSGQLSEDVYYDLKAKLSVKLNCL